MTKQILPCVWRRVDDGWQLSSSMWWVAYAGKAKAPALKGPFYWKLHGGAVSYTDSLEKAREDAEKAVLAGFDEYQYQLTNVIHCGLRELANSFGGKQLPTLLYQDKQ